MGSDQSRPSSPVLRRRRRSKEYPPSFNGFIDLYYYHRNRLLEIISEIKKIRASFEDIEKKFDRGKTASIATAVTGVAVGILAAPFTGGVSLILVGTGAAAGVSGGAAMAGVAATARSEREEAEKKIKSLQEEFQSMLASMEAKLEQMQKSCERMRESDRTDRKYKLMELELNTACLRIEVLKNQYDMGSIVAGLDKLCTQIDQTFS